jgi:hypothetical protein
MHLYNCEVGPETSIVLAFLPRIAIIRDAKFDGRTGRDIRGAEIRRASEDQKATF